MVERYQTNAFLSLVEDVNTSFRSIQKGNAWMCIVALDNYLMTEFCWGRDAASNSSSMAELEELFARGSLAAHDLRAHFHCATLT